MSFSTTLTIDELGYLAQLADFPDAGQHIGNCMELGWQRWDQGWEPSWWCERAGYPGCRDLWVHSSTDSSGVVLYYRHGGGEAIARIDDVDVGDLPHRTSDEDRDFTPDEREGFIAWLRAIHQHAEVPACPTSS